MRAFGALFFLAAAAFVSTTTTTFEAHGQRGQATSDADKKRAAKAAYDEGESAYNKGDFRRAAESFEQAYKLLPHHSALWNSGRAWLKAGEDVRAANMLERYLNEAPANAPDRDRATVAIRELDKRLGRIEIISNAVSDVKVDGVPFAGSRLWVVPGEHVATGEADGKPIRKVVAVAAGDQVSVTLELVMREETTVTPPPPPAARKPLPPWVFIVGVGATVVGGGLVVASGLDALDRKSAFDLDPQSPSKFSAAEDAEGRTNLAIGVTAGIGVLTLISYFLTDWDGGTKRSGTTKRLSIRF